MAPHYIPDGYHAVTPYLLVEGAARLIEFVTLVFDATTELISYHEDKIGHATLRDRKSVV